MNGGGFFESLLGNLGSAVKSPTSVIDPKDGMLSWSAIFDPKKRARYATIRGEEEAAAQAAGPSQLEQMLGLDDPNNKFAPVAKFLGGLK